MAKSNIQTIVESIVEQKIKDFDDYVDTNKFFEFFTSSLILQKKELNYDDIRSGICGDSNDGGVDSCYLFVDDEIIFEIEDFEDTYKRGVKIEFIIIQSKNQNGFGESSIFKFEKVIENLFDLDFDKSVFAKRYNEKIISSFDLFRNIYIYIYIYIALASKFPELKILYYYATKGIDIHPNTRHAADELILKTKSLLPSASIDFIFYGAHQIFEASQYTHSDSYRLKLSEQPISTSENTYIGIAKLGSYYRFITNSDGEIIRHIFKSNVRDYQGKTNVNKDIQNSLINDSIEDFWWLNNGVTILASETTFASTKEIIVNKPEIVNGLQTSTEISNYFSCNKDKIETDKRNLLIRIIVPENDESRDKIIRATNSQTPIPKASLRATDGIHRLIEEYFKSKDLFYDRRKNYYKNQGKQPKDIISIPYLSQCLMSVIMQKPNFARARPSTLLEDDTAYNMIFNDTISLDVYYKIAKTGRLIESIFRSLSHYKKSDINNILYYVIYFHFAILCKTPYPSSPLIDKINIDDIYKVESIIGVIDYIYHLYTSLGRNDSVAKGTMLIDEIKKVLSGVYIK